MALKCPQCSADNAVGEYYCVACGSPLLPETMIPASARRQMAAGAGGGEAGTTAVAEPAESQRRYRIILGDTCTICRAVSRITFPADRPPQLPIAGCRDPGGCHCALPLFASDLDEAIKAGRSPRQAAPARTPAPAVESKAPAAAAPVEARPQPVAPPDWSLPAPITQSRRRILTELTELYHQQRIQGIRIVTAPDCCGVCAEMAESLYVPSVAPPLPVVGCAQGWQCRCQYSEEPLPLDDRGLEAMRRLENLDRERQLRRQGVAIGGPRILHLAAIIAALAAIVAAVWLALSGTGMRSWDVLAPLALALISVLVAVFAIERIRPLPSPPWIYFLCGLLLLVLALEPLYGIHLPSGVGPQQLDRLAQTTVSPQLTTAALLALSRARQALAIAGLALLLLGLLDSPLAGREHKR